jgi:23S rRNA pseudouridine2457 synthase
VVVLHKPYGVLSQFSGAPEEQTLAQFGLPDDVYAAGRLDKDSEGLLVLTNDGGLQARIAHPRHKWPKTYWVQVEGAIDDEALQTLEIGVQLKDGAAAALRAERLPAPDWPPRDPPIRERKAIPTSWLSMEINEGRNRQVRRMTAAVGYPTLRLIRVRVGPIEMASLASGQWEQLSRAQVQRLKQWRP